MIKLNDNNIIIGDIKQLLHTYNLPNCFVGDYTSDSSSYSYNFIYNNYLYYHDGSAENQDDKCKKVTQYIDGVRYDNLTTNLNVENLIYDRYTHRYFGKYLRFIRDYRGIDLMCMYNCFDGEVFDKLSIDNKVSYKVPIDVTKDYTIKVNSGKPFSIRLYVDSDSFNNGKLNSTIHTICNPKEFLYTDREVYGVDYQVVKSNILNSGITKDEIIKYFDMFYLIITVDISSNDNIVVLEGDYCNRPSKNYFKYVVDGKLNISREIYKNPQLLNTISFNNNLLADRLIEYISGNAICKDSKYYDIEKLQRQLRKNNFQVSNEYRYDGIWTENDEQDIEALIIDNNIDKEKFDNLKYCDKDIESFINEHSKEGSIV